MSTVEFELTPGQGGIFVGSHAVSFTKDQSIVIVPAVASTETRSVPRVIYRIKRLSIRQCRQWNIYNSAGIHGTQSRSGIEFRSALSVSDGDSQTD
jgi:hypothetical protein